MPGWHEATREFQGAGRLAVAGIIEEQHPDRCGLFMQWKRLEWPVMVDSLNLLGVAAVPLTFLIDRNGLILMGPLKLEQADGVRQKLLSDDQLSSSDPQRSPNQSMVDLPVPNPEQYNPDWTDPRPGVSEFERWKRYADALLMWGGTDALGDAVEGYRKTLELREDDGPSHFCLGVAYRRRYDSPLRRSSDFQEAVRHWKRALDTDPNQYIWRRRIQQYGPRLDKPYSFYDWVIQARADIHDRGEKAHQLAVEPGGAEFATRREKLPRSERVREPDPEGRIHRDDGNLVSVETTAVPPVIEPGEATMIHLILAPRRGGSVHWNNEAEDLRLWLNLPRGWQVERRLLSVANPRAAESAEARILEFEVRAPKQAAAGNVDLTAYALFYVCEESGGKCLYRRRDIEIPLTLRRAM